MQSPESETFDSVHWETVPSTSSPSLAAVSAQEEEDLDPGRLFAERLHLEDAAHAAGGESSSKWNGWLSVRIVDYKKELENGKESYVTYGVEMKTNLPTFTTTRTKVRRRFQDFVFLHNNLVKDFPACIVPPLPDKHRLEYLPGRDRFGAEFLEKRVEDLQRFLTRISRHPTLRRATLVSAFLEATDWAIKMHRHLAHPPGPDPPPGVLDTISDSLVSLTSGKVRKPDERFEEMRAEIERFEYGLGGVEKGAGRLKSRVGDLAEDYNDFATSIKALGYLESGITDPLNRFADRMVEFSTVLRHVSTTPLPPLISHLHSLLLYSQTHRSLLALRDQKQLDSEILSEYLTSLAQERDRLASLVESGGHAPQGSVGISTYLKDRVDSLRGKDDIGSRREKMRKLDGKIKDLQDALTSAVDTCTEFSDETLREHENFELTKKEEMKELLGEFADTQIEMYKRAMEDWDKVIPVLSKIRVDV